MVTHAEVFLAHLREDLRPQMPATSELQRHLTELVDAARQRWPDLTLEAESFLADMARIVELEPEPVKALAQINAPDLYLACACARGDSQALASFRTLYLCEVGAAVASLRAPPALAEEVQQIVSQKLFTAAPDCEPRIRDYRGRGNLKTWFRVIVTRTAVSLLRKGAKEAPTPDDALLSVRAQEDDPELATLKRRYHDDFKAAFELAVDALDVRQRNLLRHQLVDELTVDEIAAIYRVHRVTASRWLAQARRDVWRGTRQRLTERLGATSAELRSLLRVIRTDLDLSLTRVLADTSRAADPM